MFSRTPELYDEIYGSFKDYQAESAQLAALLAEVAPAAETVLDVACGTGTHVLHLRRDHGYSADGLDIESGFVELARRKVPEASFWQGDMASFDLSRRFDAVVCLFSSIGYVRTIDRLEAALASGGVGMMESRAPGASTARKAHRLLFLAVGGLAAGCGGPSDGATASNGGPLVLGPSEVHVLGSSPSIAVVRDMEVARDGSVWLLNSVEPLFIGFDASGTLIAEHGVEGGGPEELRMPSGFVAGGFEAESWVVDYVRHSLIRVSSPDQAWREVPVPSDSIPPRSLMGGMSLLAPTLRTARLGDEVILPRTTGSMDSGLLAFRLASLRPDLMAFAPETGTVRHLLSLDQVLGDPAPGWADTEGGIPLWYRLWAACGDHLRVYDRVGNVLRGFDANGNEGEPIDLPPGFDEVTPTQFARAVFPLRQAEVTGAVGPRLSAADSARVLREIAQGVRGGPRDLASYLPRYVDLRCADDGTAWIQPLDLEVGGLEGGPTWIRIGPGPERREVHLPPRFDAYAFTPERIWGVQRNELDVASVAWIDLP